MIRYNNGAEFKKYFHNWILFYSEFSDYIQEFFIKYDDMELDGDSPIKIKFDLTSFRCLETI